MKLGYITKQSPKDKRAYSGIHFNMFKALQNNFDVIFPYGPVDSLFKIIPKLEGKVLSLFSNKLYKFQYNIKLAKRMARIIDQRIEHTNPDVLLASLMSPEVAYIESQKPLFITTDATFPLLNELYQSHSNLHPKSIKEALHMERRAFERAKKLVLPLNWLADSAIRDYGIPASKIEVIPYGSNLNYKLQLQEVNKIIESRISSPTMNLLFVGLRWEEKGGPFAVQVLKELLKLGVNAKLKVVGCAPKITNNTKEIDIIGFLDKNNPAENVRLKNLYKEASFFILPTTAECIGMSFIEAASMGLPAIGTNVGGVPEAVSHNKSGFILENKNALKDLVVWINKVWSNESQYRKLSKSAYFRYLERMNWNKWSKDLHNIISLSVGK